MKRAASRSQRLLCLAAGMLTVGTAWPAPAAEASPPVPASDTADVRVYVPNQLGASISILDGGGRLLETVDLTKLGFSPHAMPHQVAAAADGSAWYVTLAGDGAVAAFDADNRLVGRVTVEAPGMIGLDATRGLLHVTRSLTAVRPPSSLVVLRADDLSLVEEPEIFISRPHALAVDAVSGRVYAGSLSSGAIAAYDPARGEVEVTDLEEEAPNGFVGLAVSPDGRRLVATTQFTDRMLALDASDAEPLRLVASLAVAAGPYDAAFSPDGRLVWFPNQRAGAVTAVDVEGWTIREELRHEAFVEPHGVISSPDGRTLYVTSHGSVIDDGRDDGEERAFGSPDMTSRRANGTVSVIDVATGAVISVVDVGPYAAAPGLATVRRR